MSHATLDPDVLRVRQTSVLDGLAEKRLRDEQALQAKREAARLRRREQDRERRVDPDDNKGYTWEELRRGRCLWGVS